MKYVVMIFTSALSTLLLQADQSSLFLSSPATEQSATSFQNLTATITPYPIMGIASNSVNPPGSIVPEGSQKIVQGVTNRKIKSSVPKQVQESARLAGLSILHPKQDAFKAYPSSGALFAGYSEASTTFSAMINLFQSNPAYVSFFRKVHLNALSSLYHYLLGIYVNFSLQHPGITQNSSGKMNISIPAFFQEDQIYHLNLKTMIINQLINIIESQFNGAIRSCSNKIPQMYATYMGRTFIHCDYSTDLSNYVTHQTNPQMIAHKNEYLKALSTCITFFQAYTSYLDQPSSTNKSAMQSSVTPSPLTTSPYVAFVNLAEQINTFLYGSTSAQDKNTALWAKMNPPLLHFNYDDIKALRLIPHLAQKIPTNSKSVAWPEHLVQAAQQGLILNSPGQKPHPIAYFRTRDNQVVRNLTQDISIPLYVCMRQGENIFEQEVIAQPDWLNSWQGILNILRACYGDFSAILDLNILDPFTQAVLQNAILIRQGKNINDPTNTYPECEAIIQQWKQQNSPTTTTPTATKNVPSPKASSKLPALPSLTSLPSLPSLLPT